MKNIIKRNLPNLFNVLKHLYIYYVEFLMALFSYFELAPKILFISNWGKAPCCNPLYIYREVSSRNMSVECKWAVNQKWIHKLSNLDLTKYRSVLFFYHMSTAKVIISNVRLPYYWKKRNGQIYIQTWHSGIGLKKCEADVVDSLTRDYVKDAMSDASKTDLMLSNSLWESELYRKSFWYKGEILECGLPREDVFATESPYAKNAKKAVLDTYDLNNEEDLHLALYVPTFRVDESMEAYNIDYELLLNNLRSKWKGNWKIILRLHPNIQNKQKEIDYCKDILNGSKYSEINDLILSSDIVISDYSSCMFDAMLANKKVFLYASDVDDYMKDRGTLFKFEELPFSLAHNNSELSKIIKEFDETSYNKKCEDFKKGLGIFEIGHGAKSVVDWIEKRLR